MKLKIDKEHHHNKIELSILSTMLLIKCHLNQIVNLLNIHYNLNRTFNQTVNLINIFNHLN